MGLAAGLAIFGAAAQDEAEQMRARADKLKMEATILQVEKQVAEAKVIGLSGGVMGPPVKGAPYSADEVRETNQVLGDGTRIHNESKVTVYRDGEGRVRRETPNEISIWDPASGANYVLDPKTMTARKMKMNFVINRKGPGEPPQNITMTYRTFGEAGGNVGSITLGDRIALAEDKAAMAGAKIVRREPGKVDSLGTKVIEGVTAEGEMRTNTIEAGEIGNDRPIQSTMERWYSQDLQTVVMTRRNDPRTGEEIFKLTNIHRGEPAPVLFEVPPGYTVK
jgi:hypothetical protein